MDMDGLREMRAKHVAEQVKLMRLYERITGAIIALDELIATEGGGGADAVSARATTAAARDNAPIPLANFRTTAGAPFD